MFCSSFFSWHIQSVYIISGMSCLIHLHDFFVLLSIYLSTSQVRFKNGPEYLTRGTAQVFIPLIRFLLCSLVSNSFLLLSRCFFFKFIFCSSLHVWWYSLPTFSSICSFPFLCSFWSFLGFIILILPSRSTYSFSLSSLGLSPIPRGVNVVIIWILLCHLFWLGFFDNFPKEEISSAKCNFLYLIWHIV